LIFKLKKQKEEYRMRRTMESAKRALIIPKPKPPSNELTSELIASRNAGIYKKFPKLME
jgi:hypothetical protein